MSHLLCLNSRDNYPNKCPHICLHLTVKQHLTARVRLSAKGAYPSARRRIIPITTSEASTKHPALASFSSRTTLPQNALRMNAMG